MAIAKTLINYLEEKGVNYDLVEHAHTSTSFASARASDLPPHQVAKAVVLKDDDGFVVSVLPTNHSLEIGWVNDATFLKHFDALSMGEPSRCPSRVFHPVAPVFRPHFSRRFARTNA